MTKYAKQLRLISAVAVLFSLLALAFVVAGPSPDARAEIVPLEEALAEMSIGSTDAPVVMHEFASLTCPHCAAFHTETLPKIKAAYVDTGKVRIIYHDFPLGDLALAATMLARCSGEDRYFSFLNILYASQQAWSRAESPMQALIGISRMVGLSKADVEQCFEMDDLLWGITEAKNKAAATYKITSTPTFFVEGMRINGSLPYEDFVDAIEKALANKAGN